MEDVLDPTEIENVNFDSSSESLAILLSQGLPEIKFNEDTTFALTIREEDPEDVKDVKKSIEFTISTAQEMVTVLKRFAIQTGNPRFFETINSFLLTINGSIGKLIDVKKAHAPKADKPSSQNAESITNIQQNIYGQSEEQATKMSAKDAFRAANSGSGKVIDG